MPDADGQQAKQRSLSPLSEREAIHEWFSLSYASFLVLPRTLLQSMPDEWQGQFVALLREYDDHWRELPEGFLPGEYRVQPVESGRLLSWDFFRLPRYSRGRTRVSPDGTINGERFPR